jgi:hypothetical protein
LNRLKIFFDFKFFNRGSRKTLWLIGCIFIAVGLLAIIGLIAALTIAFGS